MVNHMWMKEKEVLKKLMKLGGPGSEFVIQYRDSIFPVNHLDGFPCSLLCMELCAYSLHDIFQGRARSSIGERLTPADSSRIADELLSGLAHLHANRVAHMDLRPRNILFLPKSPSKKSGKYALLGRLKIADYGLAKDRMDKKNERGDAHSVSNSFSVTFTQVQVAGLWSSWQGRNTRRHWSSQ